MLAGTAVPAFATHCFNANKPDGAGTIGDVIINAATGEPSSLPTNPGGQVLRGGFHDLWLDTDGDGDGDIKLANDVFTLNAGSSKFDHPALGFPPVLPEGALNAGGPGKGVDSS